MKRTSLLILAIIASFGLGFASKTYVTNQEDHNIEVIQINNPKMEENIKLGAFSVSLSVKDLTASKKFYEKLGFTVLAGDMEKNYLIMKNENSLIGLFQGMFENNILTFNPGWDENGQNIEKFDDVRKIQRRLLDSGLKIDNPVDEKTTGAAGFMVTDPDGNTILIDQHR